MRVLLVSNFHFNYTAPVLTCPHHTFVDVGMWTDAIDTKNEQRDCEKISEHDANSLKHCVRIIKLSARKRD